MSSTFTPSLPIYLCGGFPCQDLSSASHGRGNGLDGKRSGLWFEFERIIGELEPSFVIVENVALAAARWLPTVRRNLRLLGYRNRALRIDARTVGAPHSRPRIFVIAYSNQKSQSIIAKYAQMASVQTAPGLTLDRWPDPPEVHRMADGSTDWVDRNAAIGDAVVPAAARVAGFVLLEWLARGLDTLQVDPDRSGASAG